MLTKEEAREAIDRLNKISTNNTTDKAVTDALTKYIEGTMTNTEVASIIIQAMVFDLNELKIALDKTNASVL